MHGDDNDICTVSQYVRNNIINLIFHSTFFYKLVIQNIKIVHRMTILLNNSFGLCKRYSKAVFPFLI